MDHPWEAARRTRPSQPPTRLAASVRRSDRRAFETFAHVPLWRHGSPKEYKPDRASRSSSRVVSVTRQVHHEIVYSGKLVSVLEWPSEVRGRESRKGKRLSKVLYNLIFLLEKICYRSVGSWLVVTPVCVMTGDCGCSCMFVLWKWFSTRNEIVDTRLPCQKCRSYFPILPKFCYDIILAFVEGDN